MSLPNTQRDSRLRPLTVFEQAARIDFAQLDARQEQHVKATGSLVADAVRDIQKNVVNQVQRHQIIKKGRYGQARKIKINTKKVQTLLYNSFMYVYLEGKVDAKRETEASLGKRIRFADEIALLTPIESQEKFRKRVPIRKSEFAKMSARERNKAFTVAGVLEKDMIGSVQTLIDKSIDQGWTQAEFKTALEKANVKYTGTVYGTDKLKGEPITPYHMETILRTNFADVYNRGRDSFFNDPDVAEFVPAFQYSAILDSRTREDHRKMDGRIYNRDDPIWMRWNPPNGFNCFPEGTLITNRRKKTSNRPVPIEKIRVGDMVYTHLGNWKPVTHVHARWYWGELIEVKLESGKTVSCTPNHRLLTKDGWKRADELRLDDTVITLDMIKTRMQWHYNPLRREIHRAWAKMQLPVPKGTITKPESQRSHPCPICGIWVYATVGDYKEHCFVKCAAESGAYSSPLEKNPAWKGGISFLPYPVEFNAKLKRYIRERDDNQCQRCGNNDRILVVHHVDADKDNNELLNLITLCNVCHGQVQHMPELEESLWIRAFINELDIPDVGEAICANPGITRVPYAGLVYNLTVQDDESYIANQIAVHNCRCLRVPVTVNQDYSVSNPTNLKPDEGFGGRADI